MKTHEKAAALKRAELRLKSLEVEEESLREQIASSERRRSQVREEVQKQRALLQRLSQPGQVHLTEHAILRYIERVMGVRIEADELVPPEVVELWQELGDGKYPVGSPVGAVVNHLTAKNPRTLPACEVSDPQHLSDTKS